MPDFADLEISLDRHDSGGYSVEMRLSQPTNENDIRVLRGDTDPVQFDFELLRGLAADAQGYGKALAASLFGNEQLRTAFATIRAITKSSDTPLRIRLFISPKSVPELHSLRWETICDPQDGTSLISSERVFFSRFGSTDWSQIRLRPKGQLRALVVIADPKDVSKYKPGGQPLAPIDVSGELERAQRGLGTIPITAIYSGGAASLDKIIEQLRQGYDILYLVAHGALIKSEPYLWLEDEDGEVAVTAGGELIRQIRAIENRPRLIVLASCQSAGTGEDATSADGGALSAIGPRMLSEASIPAVLAMQGSVFLKTIAEFMPVFFDALQRDGQIDRAVALARNAVRGQSDWWMPVLYTSLKNGRIWYVPGFGEDSSAFAKWPALISNIRNGKCTPIIGPGLNESLIGSSREIARRWADTYHYPMEPQDRDDLPQVAQYLAVNQQRSFPPIGLRDYLRGVLVERYGASLTDEQRKASLDEMMKVVGAARRQADPQNPHLVLARQPFPIYITTTPDSLLADALRSVGKQPVEEICKWNDSLEQLPSYQDSDPQYRPSEQRPLVYYLFGQLAEPDSVVLTEDDYFDFLHGVTNRNDLIPPPVRRALADTALLFLGFQLDDWNFRVLFRSIMKQEGGSRRRNYAHVGVQVNLEEGRIDDPDRARKYLESYFQGAFVSVYWGNAEDFIKELNQRITDTPLS